MPDDQIEDLLAQHKAALNDYRHWDEKVKQLLKGRRVQDLTEKDMVTYREVSGKRDDAYNRMRQFERLLLDNIPGASTGSMPAIRPGDLEDKK